MTAAAQAAVTARLQKALADAVSMSAEPLTVGACGIAVAEEVSYAHDFRVV